jgi:regulator of replication initiation timing
MNGQNTTNHWIKTLQWGQIPSSPGSQTSNLTQIYHSSDPINQDSQKARFELIRRLYRTILGREPDDVGLDYYLRNSFIPEHQIAKDMYESTEHADLLMKAKDVIEMLAKLNDLTQQLKKLQEENQHLKQLNENLTLIIQSYKSVLQTSYSTTPVNSQRISDSETSYPTSQYGEAATNNPTVPTQIHTKKQTQPGQQDYIIPDPFAEGTEKATNPIKRVISSWFHFD